MTTLTIPDPVRDFVSSHAHRVVFASLSGAHLYGFPSADSDWDIRGTHVLPIDDVIGLEGPDETYELMDFVDGIELDVVTYDLRKFIELVLKRNGNVLEQVVSPHIIGTSDAHDELRDLACRSVTKHHAHHYRGLAQSRWKVLEKSPTVKPLLYAYRAIFTGIHLMNTGLVEANLVNLMDGDFEDTAVRDLVDRKINGAEKEPLAIAELDHHHQRFVALFEGLEAAHQASSLPDVPPTRDALNAFLKRMRKATS